MCEEEKGVGCIEKVGRRGVWRETRGGVEKEGGREGMCGEGEVGR